MSSEDKPQNITFIGAGNMASAIIGGLIDTGYNPSNIRAADPHPRALENLRAMGLKHLAQDGNDILSDAVLVVMAVKPQVMANVCRSLAPSLPRDAVVMSIAAGISADAIAAMLDNLEQPVVRCMPNTPSLVRCGASGLFANSHTSEVQRRQAGSIMAAVGLTTWVEQEHLLEAVTAVSGSGPAYFFAFMEAMIKKGEALGLSHQEATALTLKTALGAATLASTQNIALDVLRHNVTSPGGTTEQALLSFEADHLPMVVANAMDACVKRAQEMAEEFS